MSVTNIEQLPNEILLEIDRYLSPYDVLTSFLNLNSRFNLTISDYKYNLDLSQDISLEKFSHLCTNILPLINNSIYKLTLNDGYSPYQMFIFNTKQYDYSFPNLVCLTLKGFNDSGIDLLINMLIKSINLKILIITYTNQDQGPWHSSTIALSDYYIFCHKNNLEKLEISAASNGIILSEQLYPTLFIKDVRLSLRTLDDLFILFGIIPMVERLNVHIDEEKMTKQFSSTKLPQYLKEFHFETTNVKLLSYSNLEVLLYSIPTLESISIELQTDDLDYLNGQL
ncbi:unnamed protein product [Didymodactylos carnosus]|uniref:F-box domain-containing protein n=1 Tax=Didymodactylos carnosus TaxID=1234261 RepID=A0A8S2SQI3_9BILA|nr:unnamed protein product [Didymodactylos carnosus]CAF4244576.1 unnamed protein product [Didymodactylos carnosus]